MIYSETPSLKLKQIGMKEKGRGQGRKREGAEREKERGKERYRMKGREESREREKRRKYDGMLRLLIDLAVTGRFLEISRNLNKQRNLTYKIKQTGVMANVCKFSTPEAKAGGSIVN